MKMFKISKKDWKSISIDSANFILNESKDYIDYTVNESDKITNRSYSLVLLLSGIISVIIGFSYTQLVKNDFSNIVYLNILVALILSVLLIFLLSLIFPKKLMPKGRKPKEIAQERFLNNQKLSKEENYLSFVIQEIENSQAKIDFNLNKNHIRRNKLIAVLYIIAFIFPIYLLLAYCFLN